MTIKEIRNTIQTLNWNRRDATGGTSEENLRTRLDVVLAPHIAAVRALKIPARFAEDIQHQVEALGYADRVLTQWQENQVPEVTPPAEANRRLQVWQVLAGGTPE